MAINKSTHTNKHICWNLSDTHLFLYTTPPDMEVGEWAKIQCTPDYGYGSSGFLDWGIQPNSTLIFEIELLSIQDE